MTGSNGPADAADPDTGKAVCGAIREPLAFWLWQGMAGSPDEGRIAHVQGVEPVQFTARDGAILAGYRLVAPEPKGYLLVAQGNAMLADQLVDDLQRFRALGLDVYIYDYRGYGLSQGKRRFAAIVDDYVEILGHLNSKGYQRRLIYGISIGGVFLLNATGRGQAFDAAVIDSSPSRVSPFGCPKSYDPVNQLPGEASRLMVVSGARDNIVTPEQMEELIGVAEARGASILRHAEFAHPYQDVSLALHRHRLEAVADFLAGHLAGGDQKDGR